MWFEFERKTGKVDLQVLGEGVAVTCDYIVVLLRYVPTYLSIFCESLCNFKIFVGKTGVGKLSRIANEELGYIEEDTSS